MHGFIEMKDEDGFISGSFEVPEKSNIGQLFTALSRSSNEDSIPDGDVVLSRTEDTPHFITVAIRTQGKRIQELQEALLCLNAQTFTDFDICIVGHNIEAEDEKAVIGLVEMQPRWLKDKIEYSHVCGGSRSRPLNYAFGRSQSDYITILDDDDLVFDNWLEVFHTVALQNWGMIIYSYVFTQDWRVFESGSGRRHLEATKAPVAEYCDDYNYVLQLDTNHCPIMGLAYPRYSFSDFGLRFDESLTTTEDWDYLLRAAALCGVANTSEATSIYRLWKNAENSASLHKKIEWDKNRTRVIRKIGESPYLLPGSSAEEVTALIASGTARFNGLEKVHLVYKTRDGWHAERIYPAEHFFDAGTDKNCVRFDGLERLGELVRVNICFRDKGLMTISDPLVTAVDTEGSEVEYAFFDMESHGVLYDDYETGDEKIAFLAPSPHFAIGFEGRPKVLSSIRMEFLYSEGVHERLLTGTKLLVRAKQRIRKLKWRRGIKKRS